MPSPCSQIPRSHQCYRWPFVADSPPLRLSEAVATSGYSSSVAPDALVDVDVQLVVEEVQALDEVDKQLAMTVTMDVAWTDKRLAMEEECKTKLNVTDCDQVSVQIMKES